VRHGPPLLLVHGWPQNWYVWRLVMSALARDFEVIAPDQPRSAERPLIKTWAPASASCGPERV
jgi:pimeloyl-ACP methyl ester carboxylesterase